MAALPDDDCPSQSNANQFIANRLTRDRSRFNDNFSRMKENDKRNEKLIKTTEKAITKQNDIVWSEMSDEKVFKNWFGNKWHLSNKNHIDEDVRKNISECPFPLLISNIYEGKGLSDYARGDDAPFYTQTAWLGLPGVFDENAGILVANHDEALGIMHRMEIGLPEEMRGTFARFKQHYTIPVEWEQVCSFLLCFSSVFCVNVLFFLHSRVDMDLYA